MARRKTITKEQILNAAYDVVASEGFSKLTARSIASKMKCSTQPIYLEFKNMEDLKNALFLQIEDYLTKVILEERHTNDVIVDMALNYVHFACNEQTLYRTLFLDNYENSHKMTEFVYRSFMESIENDEEISKLSEEKKKALLTGTWIVSTGIASLQSGHLMQPSDQEIIAMMENVISSIKVNEGSPYFV